MLTFDALRARVRRLHELYCELAKETHIPKAEEADPLLFLERQAYRQAMHLAIGGIEDARVVLAAAIPRIDEDAARYEGSPQSLAVAKE
jgi:hypothetical protein